MRTRNRFQSETVPKNRSFCFAKIHYSPPAIVRTRNRFQSETVPKNRSFCFVRTHYSPQLLEILLFASFNSRDIWNWNGLQHLILPSLNSTFLLRKSMDWFLYDNGLRHERVKEMRFVTSRLFFLRQFLPKRHYVKDNYWCYLYNINIANISFQQSAQYRSVLW